MNNPKAMPIETNPKLDEAFEVKKSRYLVGIDLGTTNCAVAFIDTHARPPKVQSFGIEQMVDASTRATHETLPSFHYELMSNEQEVIEPRFQFGSKAHMGIVGHFARDRCQEMPGRSIASAKSWLCNAHVDRTSELLPWGADEDIAKISPVEASRRYLEQIRRVWDRAHPNAPLSEQDTIVTLPASFDELARRLTIEAAEKAGIRELYLIEEPQAAFYAWLESHESTWTEKIRPGQSILVCDVGGGTTDFTLIRVTDQTISQSHNPSQSDISGQVAEELQQTYGLHRVAVGEHLMLGGDNLDLALAKAIEEKLLAESEGAERLKPRQWDALKLQCRSVKEAVLGANPPETYRFSIPGSGSKLIENTRAVTVDRDWAQAFLLQGFFAPVALTDRPAAQESGFQEFGLPYASDPNILCHLAEFLWEHRRAGRHESESSMPDLLAARPDWVLFNGGVLESPQVQKAVVDQLSQWFSTIQPDWRPGVLDGNRLDLAVAQGAAYYGNVRRGEGVKIDAKLAKAYYIQVEQNPPRAMCIMPANAQPGDQFTLAEQPLQVLAGAPVQFPVFVSSTHLIDRPGDIVEIDPNVLHSAAPIHTVLELPRKNQQRTIGVHIRSELSEIGTLQIQLVSSEDIASDKSDQPYAWQLECDTRSASTGLQNALQKSIDTHSIALANNAIEEAFGTGSEVPTKEVWDVLSRAIGTGRRDWDPNLLREMWKGLIDRSEYRKRSPAHEARWLNLVGWTLRPGFGVVADDWRVQTTWRTIHNKLVHRSPNIQSEVIILWRRISGGFTAGQQQALFQDVWSKLRPVLTSGNIQSLGNNIAIELIRLIGSLERLSVRDKETALQLLVEATHKKKLEPLFPALLWSIGRIGTRVPLYAGFDHLVRAERIENYAKKLAQAPMLQTETTRNHLGFCLVQCTRLTGDRRRDVSSAARKFLVDHLQTWDTTNKYIRPITEQIASLEDLDSIVGDSLPLGFSMPSR